MKSSVSHHMPRSVAKRIVERASQSGDPIVITSRKGKLSRVYGYTEYQKMVGLPQKTKPWEHRKTRRASPDPLGAIDAKPPSPLTRESFYEED
jgi:hypothetical protein